MSYKVLYRKYRPENFENLVGQEYTVEMLKNSIQNEKISHAYIFTGPRGTGKTSAAKIFAKAINCLHPINGDPCNECEHCKAFKESPDIIEIDAASNNGVDEIRELINNVKLSPSEYKYKVYIIDEVHMLSTSAFNALLLTLEEPPSHVVFILATTDIQNVPITILSRCQRFDFKRIENSTIVRRLTHICEKEQIQVTEEALNEIALLSEGGLRDALGMLDQLSTSISREISVEDVISHFGTVSSAAVEDLFTAFDKNDISLVVSKLHNFKNSSLDYKVIVKKLLSVLEEQAILLKTMQKSCRLSFESIYQLILELNSVVSEAKINVDPYILIEMVLLKYMDDKVEKTATVAKVKDSSSESTETLSTPEIQEDNVISDTYQEEVVVPQEKPEVIHNNKVTTEISKKIDQQPVPIITDSWVNVRINNCFCEAQKQALSTIKNNWAEFLEAVKETDMTIYGFLIDAEPVAASSDYAIFASKIDSNALLLNENVLTLESIYEKILHANLHIVVLSEERWKAEKETYIKNAKSNKTYSLLPEEELKFEEITETDELEGIANDIFSNDVDIEIE